MTTGHDFSLNGDFLFLAYVIEQHTKTVLRDRRGEVLFDLPQNKRKEVKIAIIIKVPPYVRFFMAIFSGECYKVHLAMQITLQNSH